MKKLVVGLGNPGEKYMNTRHNVGYEAVDYVVSKLSATWKNNKKFNADVAVFENIIFLKPLTYMNLSGGAVVSAMAYYNVDLDGLTVIHDDADLDEATYKLEKGRGSAGHNGVADIISHVNSKDFWRIRIGISRPENKSIPLETWVLMKMSQQEIENLEKLFPEIEKSIYKIS